MSSRQSFVLAERWTPGGTGRSRSDPNQTTLASTRVLQTESPPRCVASVDQSSPYLPRGPLAARGAFALTSTTLDLSTPSGSTNPCSRTATVCSLDTAQMPWYNLWPGFKLFHSYFTGEDLSHRQLVTTPGWTHRGRRVLAKSNTGEPGHGDECVQTAGVPMLQECAAIFSFASNRQRAHRHETLLLRCINDVKMSRYYQTDEMDMYQRAMMARGGAARRFDEYYRCYSVAMMPGPERESANHGGKIFLPASALDKLTQLHITYPMLFELINGAHGKTTHAGVLEFTAEEGRCYLPYWLMSSLTLEPGDLVQIKSTDLPSGSFIKLQPQNTNFLDISDPKAVLETAFRNFSCLTLGDIFTFAYNDTIYEIAVLEVKPDKASHAISVQETDLEVDFAPPVGYQEPQKASGTSTPRSIGSTMAGKGGLVHTEGSMAQAINYSSIAPSSNVAAIGHAKLSSHFAGSGNRLVPKKGKNAGTASSATSGTTTPAQSASSVPLGAASKTAARNRNGPQPLRLPPNKLFFGYEIKPLRNKEGQAEQEQMDKRTFAGEGNTLRKKKDAK
nr:ubiquitin fusion degradation protein 1 [Quercus suber]